MIRWHKTDEAIVIFIALLALMLGVMFAIYFSDKPKDIKVNLKFKSQSIQSHKIYKNTSISKSTFYSDTKQTWYCDAGSCKGGNGAVYNCGATLCDLKQTACGCTCIEISGAPYPKSFCGTKSPYSEKETEPDTYTSWIFHPFEINDKS
jgi:hypothetical protein